MRGKDVLVLAAIVGAAYWFLKPKSASARTVVANDDGTTTVNMNGQSITLPPGISPDDPLVQQILASASGASGGSSQPFAPKVQVMPSGGGASW